MQIHYSSIPLVIPSICSGNQEWSRGQLEELPAEQEREEEEEDKDTHWTETTKVEAREAKLEMKQYRHFIYVKSWQ